MSRMADYEIFLEETGRADDPDSLSAFLAEDAAARARCAQAAPPASGASCAASGSGDHRWICITPVQGPDATYGCFYCPARAKGSDLA